jgi:hypothetical protein
VPVCRNLLEALHREHIHAEFLPHTSSYKHVWARDYMPIQLEKTLVLFYEYWPDYLNGYEDYIPNVLELIDYYHLGRIPVEILLDGGNVVGCGNKVIMTDKIFKENDWWDKKELIETLEYYLKAQIVFIPWDRYEIFGHADGMVRWIDRNRVLLNNYGQTDPSLRKRLLEALSPHFVVEELEYNVPRLSKLSWAYLNFLRVKNTIFVPGLHAKEDEQALEQIQRHYPYCKVIQIQGCEELARDGGALHCVTWNVLADVPDWVKEEA